MAKSLKIEQPKIPEPQLPEQAKKLLAEKEKSEAAQAVQKKREAAREKALAEEDLRIEANNDYNSLYNYPANREAEAIVTQGEFMGEKGERVRLECFGYTLGDHKINQDAGFFDAEKGIIGVCDGAGGHKGGEKASRKTAEIINEEMANLKYKKFENEQEFTQAKIEYKQALQKIKKRTKQEVEEGITTASFVKVLGELEGKKKVAVSWAGDSSVYIRHQDGTIEKVTEDHNRLEELKRGERKAKDVVNEAVIDFPEGRVGQIGGLEVLKEMIEEVSKCETAFDLKKINIDGIYSKLGTDIEVEEKMTIKDLLRTLRYLQRGISRCQGKGCTNTDFDTKYIDLEEGEWIFVASDAIGDNVPHKTLEKVIKGNVNDFQRLGVAMAKKIRKRQRGIKPDDLTIEAMQLAA